MKHYFCDIAGCCKQAEYDYYGKTFCGEHYHEEKSFDKRAMTNFIKERDSPANILQRAISEVNLRIAEMQVALIAAKSYIESSEDTLDVNDHKKDVIELIKKALIGCEDVNERRKT